MNIPNELKKIAQIIAILLAIGGGLYISSTAKMSMGNYSGNGR